MTTTEADHSAAKKPLSRRARMRAWKRTVIDRGAQEAFSKESRWTRRDEASRRKRRMWLSALGGAVGFGLLGAAFGVLLDVKTPEIVVPDHPQIHAAANRLFPEALHAQTQVSILDGQAIRIALAIPQHTREAPSTSHDPIKRLSGEFVGEVPRLSGLLIKKRIERIMAEVALPIPVRCYTFADGAVEDVQQEFGGSKSIGQLILTLQQQC